MEVKFKEKKSLLDIVQYSISDDSTLPHTLEL